MKNFIQIKIQSPLDKDYNLKSPDALILPIESIAQIQVFANGNIAIIQPGLPNMLVLGGQPAKDVLAAIEGQTIHVSKVAHS